MVPGARSLVQETGTGSERQTGRRLAEQPQREIVGERQPALGRCKNTRPFLTQPEKFGGPVAGMKAATSARVNLGFMESRTQLFGSLSRARFSPTKNRCGCLSFRGDANQTVPETGDRYQLDACGCLIRPGKERVDRARDLLDQLQRMRNEQATLQQRSATVVGDGRHPSKKRVRSHRGVGTQGHRNARPHLLPQTISARSA